MADAVLKGHRLKRIIETEIGDRLLISPAVDIVQVPKNLSQGLASFSPGTVRYCYLPDIDPNTISLIVRLLLDKDILPEIIFSDKRRKDEFLRCFYNTIIDNNTACYSQKTGKYLLLEGFEGLVWTGITRMRLSNLTSNELAISVPKIMTAWDPILKTESNLVLYLKTTSRELHKSSLSEYYDYEDRLFFSPEYTGKPILIILNDVNSLPRPEKISIEKRELCFDIEGIKIRDFKIGSEEKFGLPTLKYEDNSNQFISKLRFYERSRFIRFIIKNYWANLASFLYSDAVILLRLPDDYERETLSDDLSIQNSFVTECEKIRSSLTNYKFENLKFFLSHRPPEDLIIDLNQETIFNLRGISPDRRSCYGTILVPKHHPFRDVFKFLFAKEIFYHKLISEKMDHCDGSNSRSKANEFVKSVFSKYEELSILDKEDNIDEKIHFEEQYGKESLIELKCKRIIFSGENGEEFFTFVPLFSNSRPEAVYRNERLLSLSYSELSTGDIIERKYWTYHKLVTKIENNSDLLYQFPDIGKNLKISQEFRSALRELINQLDKKEVLSQLESILREDGHDRKVFFLTISSWIDTIFHPNKPSIPVLRAIKKLCEKLNIPCHHSVNEFLESCDYLKSLSHEISEHDENLTLRYTIKKIDPGPYTVRGENIGKIRRLA